MTHASEIEGVALDEVVAAIEGWRRIETAVINGRLTGPCWWHDKMGDPADPDPGANAMFSPWYSRDWMHGGPIIERERIGIRFDEERKGHPINPALDHEARWCAEVGPDAFDGNRSFKELPWAYGHTPLIAAMRAFVASKMPPFGSIHWVENPANQKWRSR